MGRELAKGVRLSRSCAEVSLPLDPVLVAISELLPKIQETKVGGPSIKVINLLKGVSLADVLPPVQPVVPRRFQVGSLANR
jgi:hypothetical protein